MNNLAGDELAHVASKLDGLSLARLECVSKRLRDSVRAMVRQFDCCTLPHNLTVYDVANLHMLLVYVHNASYTMSSGSGRHVPTHITRQTAWCYNASTNKYKGILIQDYVVAEGWSVA